MCWVETQRVGMDVSVVDPVIAGSSRARKRPRGTATHVRSWPLRPASGQVRAIEARFHAGLRVYNACLAESFQRGEWMRADPGFDAAKAMPARTPAERKERSTAFRAVAARHGFTDSAVQSFASSLRRSWVREQVPAQETQVLGKRAFTAVQDWQHGQRGKPRFKAARRGLHSMASKDFHGALRPNLDPTGRLAGLQWGAGFVIAIAPAATTGRRGVEQQAEMTSIEALLAAGACLSARIVRTQMSGRPTYRMQLVMDGHPEQRHPIGDGRVAFDLGPTYVAIAAMTAEGRWSAQIRRLADGIDLDAARLRRTQRALDRSHRAGSPDCFRPDGTHQTSCRETELRLVAEELPLIGPRPRTG